MLYDPDEHRPTGGRRWSDGQARAAIESIAQDAIDGYQGPEGLWPNAGEDLEGEADVPYRNVYFGAAGVVWALDRLARDGLAPEWAAGREVARSLHEDFLSLPELAELEPPPAASLLFGESGILLAAEAILEDGAQLPALEACVHRNATHPSLELCWGSPGTMTAAITLWQASGQARWEDAWRASAERLLAEWREIVWIQDLYGTRQAHVGAGHGFAGNAFALLSGSDLLGEQAQSVIDRIRGALVELAQVALFARSGDELWLERARAFATDAAITVERNRNTRGRGRYSLYTGDLGVALLLASCLSGAAGFPFLERAIEPMA